MASAALLPATRRSDRRTVQLAATPVETTPIPPVATLCVCPLKPMYWSLTIGEDVWLQQDVVKGCVEGCELSRGATADLDLSKPGVPGLIRFLESRVKVSTGIFLVHISLGIGNTDERKTYAHAD